jgi:glycosyltransferase involved in cell wall biosynthesis
LARNKATDAPTIALITTCKGRLHHLKQSLPAMAAQHPDELIVVDYDSPDGAGDWVEAHFPQAKVIRASQPDGGFNVSRARNLGAAAATAEWLVFVDADILLAPSFAQVLRPAVARGYYYQPVPKEAGAGGMYGTFVCAAADFRAIGGYDEVFEGWGREDKDVYMRLQRAGVKKAFYAPGLVQGIDHDDSERHIRADMSDRWQNEAVNACYLEAKVKISVARGGRGNLPLADRRNLMRGIRRIVSEWYRAGARERLPVRFKISPDPTLRLASGIRIHSEAVVTVVLDPAPAPGAAQPASSAAGVQHGAD